MHDFEEHYIRRAKLMNGSWRDHQGPWDDEPMKREVWVDEATGLGCLAQRNDLGAWCGYVAIPEGHPWRLGNELNIDADVHGGITFLGPRQTDDHYSESGVWIVFDCSHYGDLSPIDVIVEGSGDYTSTYKTIEYVRRECTNLARQVMDCIREAEEE